MVTLALLWWYKITDPPPIISIPASPLSTWRLISSCALILISSAAPPVFCMYRSPVEPRIFESVPLWERVKSACVPNVSLALSAKVDTPDTTLILSENVVIPVTLKPPLVVSTFLTSSK